MSSAVILAVLALWLGIAGGRPPLSSQESKESQPDAQTSDPQNSTTPQETQASKPCLAASDSPGSGKPADCKSAASNRGKKHQHLPAAPSSSNGPTKTVVRNGSTSDPTVAISPDLSSQQASQQLRSTNELLARTDLNLKQIANRQLSTAQEDTVRQIKVYMEQARAAAKNGEVQRAYNLANKANLLSADLVGPRQ